MRSSGCAATTAHCGRRRQSAAGEFCTPTPAATTTNPPTPLAATVLELDCEDAVIFLGNLLHAGMAWRLPLAAAAAPVAAQDPPQPNHHRAHVYVHGAHPAPTWTPGFEVCDQVDGQDGQDDDDGTRDFRATRRLHSRKEALAAVVKCGASRVLHEAGFIILPRQRLLSRAGQDEIRGTGSAANIRAGFVAIHNGGQDAHREAWTGGEWRKEFKRTVAAMLRRAGLLAMDPDGPGRGADKEVVRPTALRSKPGCPRQPPHADFGRVLAYAAS